MRQEQKMELIRKVGVFGLNDLRKLAPIGDLGFMNGWEDGDLERDVFHAFMEQREKYGFKVEEHHIGDRGYDNRYTCEELGLKWHVCSSD